MKRENRGQIACKIKRQILAKDRVHRKSTLRLSQSRKTYDCCLK